MLQNHTLYRRISSPSDSEISQETLSKPLVSSGVPPAHRGNEGFLDPALAYGSLAVAGTLAVVALIKALTELVKAIQNKSSA